MNLVPIHPHVFFELPGSFNMLIHILIYAAGTALTALGGFHGYRYCGSRFSKQEGEAENLRDEFVFGDDLDKMYNEDPRRLDSDEAYKRALGGDTKPNALTPPARKIDDRGPASSAPGRQIGK